MALWAGDVAVCEEKCTAQSFPSDTWLLILGMKAHAMGLHHTRRGHNSTVECIPLESTSEAKTYSALDIFRALGGTTAISFVSYLEEQIRKWPKVVKVSIAEHQDYALVTVSVDMPTYDDEVMDKYILAELELAKRAREQGTILEFVYIPITWPA